MRFAARFFSMAKLQNPSSRSEPLRQAGHRRPRGPFADEGGAWHTKMPGREPSLAQRLAAEIRALKAELAAARAEMRALAARADIDGLLDILNRRGFERELRRAIAYVARYGAQAALIYLDLDRFKPINDTYGHAAGDAMLRATASTLAHNVRASDLVGRIGGDEFGLLLWNAGPAAAAVKARALEAAVARITVDWGGARLSVGASAGFAMLAPEDEPAAVIARADQAMYARKRARRAGLGNDVGR